jgi:quercetin dioxygenase-like cupin family protein
MFVTRQESPAPEVDPGITRQLLGHDPELMMVRVVFKKGAVGYVHTHPHRQVSYVERGRFEVQIGSERKVLSEGDCYFIPPGIPHGATALEDGALVDVFSPAREDFLPR